MTSISKRRSKDTGMPPVKNTEFESQIVQFANELTNIVISTNKSFNKGENRDVIVIDDSDSEAETVVIGDVEGFRAENARSGACSTVERLRKDLQCQVVNHTDTVTLDSDGEESNVELGNSHVFMNPVKLEPLVKTIDSLYEANIECLFDKPYTGSKENLASLSKEEKMCSKCNKISDLATHVCTFECDLCPYVAKQKGHVTRHKRNVHNIKGNTTAGCSVTNVVDGKVGTKRKRKTQAVCTLGKRRVRKVLVENQSLTGTSKTAEEKKATGNTPDSNGTKNGKFQCDLCSFKGKYRFTLTAHRRTIHNIKRGRKNQTDTTTANTSDDNRKFVCVCGRRFKLWGDLQYHVVRSDHKTGMK